MVKMVKAGWGMDNNTSAGGAYACSRICTWPIRPGRVCSVLQCNISNDAQGIAGTFDLTGFSGEQFGAQPEGRRVASKQTMDEIPTTCRRTSIKSLILHYKTVCEAAGHGQNARRGDE